MNRKTIGFGMILLLAVAAGAVVAANRDGKIPVAGFRVVAEYPHDADAFTQGLTIENGVLYEGTGLEGKSSLRQVDLKTGRVLSQQNLNQRYFGEGIAVLGDKIYQLTWRNRTAFVYDRDTLQYVNSINYAGEGWGLTTDGKQLFLSDGSATLKVLDPESFATLSRITVKAGRQTVSNLNELEYVNGEIWANIWHADRIARISPETGNVSGWIDLTTLYPLRQRASRENVLNGIAYDAEHKRLFVTGKNWPKLYEIEVK